MNHDFPKHLAARLRANPSLLNELDDALLAEMVYHYIEGQLDAESVADVETLLRTDVRAQKFFQLLKAADEFPSSPAGKSWLARLRKSIFPEESLRETQPSEAVIPFPSAGASKPFSLAAVRATEGSTEFAVVGKENVQVVVYHQSARLAVYDERGDPSQNLDGHRIFGRASGQAGLHELGVIGGWKAVLPTDATVDHLLPPDGDKKPLALAPS